MTDAKTAREVLTSFRGLPSWLRVFTLRATDAKIRRAAAGLLYRACDAQSSLYSINSISDAPTAAPPLASLLLAALLPMLPLLQVDAPGTTASTTTTTAATGTGTTAAAVSAAAAADSAAAATGAASNISSSTSKLSGRAGKAVVVPQENTGEFYALLAGLLHLRLETGAAPGDEEALLLAITSIAAVSDHSTLAHGTALHSTYLHG
eukprot:924-Heterococcus_DN1.PRE.2